MRDFIVWGRMTGTMLATAFTIMKKADHRYLAIGRLLFVWQAKVAS